MHIVAATPTPKLSQAPLLYLKDNTVMDTLYLGDTVWCLTTLMICVILYQTFFAHIQEIYWTVEIFIKNTLTKSILELEKCVSFKWVWILTEIDWYNYHGASLATKCIVRVKQWHRLCMPIYNFV